MTLVSCHPAPPPPHDVATRPGALTPDLAKIDDGKTWSILNGVPHASLEDGKSVVHLAPHGGYLGPGKGSNAALALVPGVDFTEGTIEIDLKGQGEEHASFLGVAFRAADARTYEAVYFRPFNFRGDDEHRVRAVQYVAWPGHTWEKLRAETPGVYEAAIAPVPDPVGWFHARIEVAGQRVRVFVNDSPQPCLVVDRLGSLEKGQVGLWVDSQDGSFRDLKIVPAVAR